MASIGDLYAPEGNAAGYLVNAVIAYTGLVIDRPDYKHMTDNKLEPFLKDFPHGKIPAFKGNNGLVLFEGQAIARYLAARAPEAGLRPASLEDRALVDQWNHLVDTEVFSPAILNWLWCNNRFGPYTQELSDHLKQRETRALTTVNNHLEGRTYVVGDSLTLADIVLATTIRFTIGVTFAKAEREQFANIFHHFERLSKEPKLEKVLGGAKYAEESVKHVPLV